MKFLLGRHFWWFIAAFHICAMALVAWFVSMTFHPYIVVGGTAAVVSKPVFGVLLWLVVAGPVTVAALLLRWLRKGR